MSPWLVIQCDLSWLHTAHTPPDQIAGFKLLPRLPRVIGLLAAFIGCNKLAWSIRTLIEYAIFTQLAPGLDLNTDNQFCSYSAHENPSCVKDYTYLTYFTVCACIPWKTVACEGVYLVHTDAIAVTRRLCTFIVICESEKTNKKLLLCTKDNFLVEKSLNKNELILVWQVPPRHPG